MDKKIPDLCTKNLEYSKSIIGENEAKTTFNSGFKQKKV
jgi:hypothetical protein